jgi:hypothetical protein
MMMYGSVSFQTFEPVASPAVVFKTKYFVAPIDDYGKLSNDH